MQENKSEIYCELTLTLNKNRQNEQEKNVDLKVCASDFFSDLNICHALYWAMCSVYYSV